MSWAPRSPFDKAAGLMWLPRLIDKGRRKLQGDELLGDYMFGDHDYLDGFLLRFLELNDAVILEILRAEPDDDRAATAIVARSGKSAEACSGWNKTFDRSQHLALLNLDRDEGRYSFGPLIDPLWTAAQGVFLPVFRFIYDRNRSAT
ncbi:MAG: hypothetical protein JWM80_5037 [Cyanobacteria bacterium RYN_339]|nr:hypothetical protein [Cyanobacteria bacterium RYN_339]